MVRRRYFPVKIVILAADSLGVRSMATYVEYNGERIIIDPSAALGPWRYGLHPTSVEEEALMLAKERIARYVERSDTVVFTHYHWDHYDPDLPLADKRIITKDPKNNINQSQRRRAALLKYKYLVADGREYGDLVFSPPLPHGPEGTRLGYVVAVRIGDLVFSSDIQGPISERAKEWIIEQNPRILIMDGPPTYFLGYKLSVENRDAAVKNIQEIMEKTDVKTIVLDHHLTRDLKYMERFPIYERAEELGVRATTGAEFSGHNPLFLEAWRRDIAKGVKEVGSEYIRRAYHD
ncbi:MAG: MBL fold metallo-hydrolase [Candidatus Diapherotrites archaeon]|nr:MBL fold metallo-hydrolase [Candidatus Diapherotrites archaeon]